MKLHPSDYTFHSDLQLYSDEGNSKATTGKTQETGQNWSGERYVDNNPPPSPPLPSPPPPSPPPHPPPLGTKVEFSFSPKNVFVHTNHLDTASMVNVQVPNQTLPCPHYTLVRHTTPHVTRLSQHKLNIFKIEPLLLDLLSMVYMYPIYTLFYWTYKPVWQFN